MNLNNECDRDCVKALLYRASNCRKCLVINERHANVLQYKESPDCDSDKDSLENLCSCINGDAQLYSLFRIDAEPEECPFRGAPFNLTYNRGHGECRDPVSRVESCTQPSRLLLKFQACPNVEKTESQDEVLECFAHWREGSNHYLIGKVEGPLGSLNLEEKYKCFIWERIRGRNPEGQMVTIGYRVAQSGYASCIGVQSATEGAKAMTLIKVTNELGNCRFPHWLTSHNWQSLDGTFSFKNDYHKNTTLSITETPRKRSGESSNNFRAPIDNRSDNSIFKGGRRLSCVRSQEVTSSQARIMVQVVDNCKSEHVCLNFVKWNTQVFNVEINKLSRRGDCGTSSTEKLFLGSVTFISTAATANRCPSLGTYIATGIRGDRRVGRGSCTGNAGDFKRVAVGCGDRGGIVFHSSCASEEPITSYACYGNWREGATGYLKASPTHRSTSDGRRFCFVYRENESGLRGSINMVSCQISRNEGMGYWAFNLNTEGPCAERLTSGAKTTKTFSLYISISVVCVILLLIPINGQMKS